MLKRNKKTGSSVHLFVILCCVLSIFLGGTGMAADKVLYDDFSGQYLDPVKWSPLESVIKVDNGKLAMQLAAKTNSGTGWTGAGDNVNFLNPESIHTIKTTVTLQEAIIRNTDTHSVGTIISGQFYKSINGNCFANIMLSYDDFGKKISASYGINDTVVFDAGLLLDNLTLNTPYVLTLSYNEATSTFTFTIDGTSKSIVAPERSGAAEWPGKSLGVSIGPKQNNGVDGYVAATFEDVYVNGALYDNFNTAPLDSTKWSNFEIIRKIDSDKLNLSVQSASFFYKTTNSINLTANQSQHVEAAFTVKSDSWLLSGAHGLARISGNMYNDSKGPGSGNAYNGWEGNVWATVAIRMRADRSLYVQYYCERANDANYNSYSELYSGNFSSSVQIDSPAVLGLSFDPVQNQIIFSCNDEKITYNIVTSVYATNEPSRSLQSRVYANPGQSGYMFVEVDNVYISNELLVTPTNRDVSRYEGTTTFAVSNLGNETLPWSAEVVSGADWLKITSGASGTDTGTITCAFDANLGFAKRTGVIRVTATGVVNKTQDVTVTQAGKPGPFISNVWGVWPDGVWSWNQATNKWALMPSTSGAKMIAAGDVDGDGVDDLIGVWDSGLWVKYSSTGKWEMLSYSPTSITSGDLTNDGRDDVIGSWPGDGVYYRDSANGKWVKITTPAKQLAVGDISGNGREDLIGVWDSGLWVLYSATAKWEKIDKNIPVWLSAGDMTGDYQSDILASYGSGTWYRDSVTTKWYSMAFSAEQLTSGDINGDGWDDMIGVWPCGLYVRYGNTQNWQLITASKPSWITTGKTAGVAQSADFLVNRLESGASIMGLSEIGPGGVNSQFIFMNETGPE